MTQHEEMHSLVVGVEVWRINLGLELRVWFQLKIICNSTWSSVFHEAFFEYERCIFLQLISLSLLLAGVIHHDVDFFDGLEFKSIHFCIHFDNVSCLFGHNVIQLSCMIFGRETQILSQDNVSEYVFSIYSFNSVLVFSGQVLVHPSWFINNKLKNVIVHLKELACIWIDLHDDGIGHFLCFFEREDLILILEWLQILCSSSSKFFIVSHYCSGRVFDLDLLRVFLNHLITHSFDQIWAIFNATFIS